MVKINVEHQGFLPISQYTDDKGQHAKQLIIDYLSVNDGKFVEGNNSKSFNRPISSFYKANNNYTKIDESKNQRSHLCDKCKRNNVVMKRIATKTFLCSQCFTNCIETEVHETISKSDMFSPGDQVAVCVSGGKDSSVLAYLLNFLNKTYNYGIKLILIAIDEGIKGYREDALKVAIENAKLLNLSINILSYDELFDGYSMDAVVKMIGIKNNINCTYCGIFRRKSIDIASTYLKTNLIATGHNADDVGQTVLMNFLRGDIQRISQQTLAVNNRRSKQKSCYVSQSNDITSAKKSDIGINRVDKNFQSSRVILLKKKKRNSFHKFRNNLSSQYLESSCNTANVPDKNYEPSIPKEDIIHDFQAEFRENFSFSENNSLSSSSVISPYEVLRIPRCKPMIYICEREIVMYARFKMINYFATECVYSVNAFRGNVRDLLEELQYLNPQIISNIIHSSKFFKALESSTDSNPDEISPESDDILTENPENLVKMKESTNLKNSNQIVKSCELCGESINIKGTEQICRSCELILSLKNLKIPSRSDFYGKEHKLQRKTNILISYE